MNQQNGAQATDSEAFNASRKLRVYLIRHGETEEHARAVYGQGDVPLSRLGIEQSIQLARALSGRPLAAVYSSDLSRAVFAASHIAAETGAPLTVSSDLREVNVGEWDGRSLAEIMTEWPGLVETLYREPRNFQFPGGESFSGFVQRIQTALAGIVANSAGELAIVAHGGVARVAIGSLLGMAASKYFAIAQNFGCINVIDYRKEGPGVTAINALTVAGRLPDWP